MNIYQNFDSWERFCTFHFFISFFRFPGFIICVEENMLFRRFIILHTHIELIFKVLQCLSIMLDSIFIDRLFIFVVFKYVFKKSKKCDKKFSSHPGDLSPLLYYFVYRNMIQIVILGRILILVPFPTFTSLLPAIASTEFPCLYIMVCYIDAKNKSNCDD